MATINTSVVLISLPDIFRGIRLNPLAPGNSGYLLWMLMAYMVVTAVLVVSFGRVGDMYGRVKMYNLGFAVFTVFSILLAVGWMHGAAGALYLIGGRVCQGVGSALLMANSSAILTDAFPINQRGLALGINMMAATSGSFIGLILGGVLGPLDWRLVFLASVPVGILGTVWAYMMLEDRSELHPARIDWWGNVIFAVGLVALLVGITYGIDPYGHHEMGWTNPAVLAGVIGGLVMLGIFCIIETRVKDPMFRVPLFRIRAFSMGNMASLLASLGRGGMMFILIIWLQGIWLPEHGYSFSRTPLWAGSYLVPLTIGFLIAGPISGILSDRYGARPFATGGMVLAALSFWLLKSLPVNFAYPTFACVILLNGLAMGIFSSPNRAGIMNSLPPDERGAGAGMVNTFQNSAQVLSMGIYFTLIIWGLASQLPVSLYHGLVVHGVPVGVANRVSHLSPVGSLFAAFLGISPIRSLLGPSVLSQLPHATALYLTGRKFFPDLITAPFKRGLDLAFDFSIASCLLGAACSWIRGKRYIYGDGGPNAEREVFDEPDFEVAQSEVITE